MAFLFGLCWDTIKLSSRRSRFPSWSWTGWNSPVKWGDDYTWKYVRANENVQVTVELTDGRVLDWEMFNRLKDTLDLTCGLKDLIRFSAWTSSLRILKRRSKFEMGRRPRENSDGYTAKIKLEDGGYICWKFKPTTNVPLEPNQRVIGIHLAHTSENFMEDGKVGGTIEAKAPALLIVGKVGSIIERIGLGRITDFNYDEYYEYDEYDNIVELFDQEGLLYAPQPPLRLAKSWQTIQLG